MPTGTVLPACLHIGSADINNGVLNATYLVRLPYGDSRISSGFLSATAGGERNHPVVSMAKGATGIVNTFGADWYNRIHVTPVKVDVGNLLTPQERDVTVWNAYVTPKTLDSLVETADSGVTIEQPGALPYTFSPLEDATYIVKVNLNGPPKVSGEYLFDFITQQITLVVTGSRIVLWPFMPQHGVTEGLEWKTDVIRTKSSEQRIALRDAPRQTLAYSFFMNDRQVARARALAYGWAHRVFGVPVWTDASFIGTLPVGSMTVTVSTTNADYRVGETVLIWESDEKFEAIGIASVQAGSLTLDLPSTVDFASAYVAPVRYARADALTMKRGGNELVKADADFWTVDNKDHGASIGLPTYLGLDVMTDVMYDIGGFEEKVIKEVTKLDNGFGEVFVDAKYSTTDEYFTLSWSFRTRAELWRIKRWLSLLKGKWKAFWLPTKTKDLEIVDNFTSEATAITVKSIGYSLYYSTRVIQIVRKTGEKTFHSVIGGSTAGANDILSLSASIGFSAAYTDIDYVSFVYKVRLDTDRIEIAFEENNNVTVKVPAIEVKA